MTGVQTSRANSTRKAVHRPKYEASVVDIFCGAGGLSHGFMLEGFDVAAGIDLDESCRFAYEANNDAPFLRKDVSKLTVTEVNKLFTKGRRKVLVGCAPCQPFSVYNQKNDDPNWKLLSRFAKLIEGVKPDIVSMENVPRLLNFRGGKVFKGFVSRLRKAGFYVSWQVVYAPDYGVPQQRSRLVLLASRHTEVEFIKPTHGPDSYLTVEEAIGHLTPLKAGDEDEDDRLHKCSSLANLNLKRIRAASPGGTWREWQKSLVTPCHRVKTGKGYSSVYGRMEWGSPSPTITTQFFGFGNGRFGHPDQDRALSLREGAILQSFPEDYAFVPAGQPIQMKTIGKMIGNAVPVGLAKAIARSIGKHLRSIE